jgi:uncharacterized protein (TIGR03435 family)
LKRLAGMWPAMRLVSSTARLEPGVFGIFRPVLWLPVGIGDRLDNAELEAILAHELCHARRRDNLAAAVHMAVEAIFWFHPLVWWLGARLTEERERACDEEVVRMGGEPQVYAESILKVCEFYLASPVACAAGVTGGGLKKRIEGIMGNRRLRSLSLGKKILLAVAGLMAVGAPIVAGVMALPPGHARSRVLPAAARVTAPLLALAASSPPPWSLQPQAPAAVTATKQRAPATEPLSFEVASIKPHPPRIGPRGEGYPGCNFTSSGPRATLGACFVLDIIMEAYNLKDYQVSFAPSVQERDWQHYDIVAKAEGDGARTRSEFRQMLQSLLAERFRLKVHRATKEMPVYALVVGKNGPKFKESATAAVSSGHGGLNGRNQSITATKEDMDDLARVISNSFGPDRPVVNRTGLTGLYDFRIEATPEWWINDNPQPDDLSVFTAVQDQLGLKLEPQKADIETLEVDHVEKPTEN